MSNENEDDKKEITEREAEEFAKAIIGGGIDKIEIPASLPILPVHEMTLYPEMIAPVLVGREESRKLVDDALLKDKLIGVVGLKDNKDTEPEERNLYLFGTFCPLPVYFVKFFIYKSSRSNCKNKIPPSSILFYKR